MWLCICVYVLLYAGTFARPTQFGFRNQGNLEPGIPLTNEIQNPSAADKDLEYLEFGIQGVESRFQDCHCITSPFSLVFENAEKLSFKFSCRGFCPLEVYCPYFHIP